MKKGNPRVALFHLRPSAPLQAIQILTGAHVADEADAKSASKTAMLAIESDMGVGGTWLPERAA